MAGFEKFNFMNLSGLKEKIKELAVDIRISEDISPLKKVININGKAAPNSMAILPMEGCDGNPDGSPSELTVRRYLRFSGGGAGLLCYEACAVVSEGRANPLQLCIHQKNIDSYKSLIEMCNANAMKENNHKPVNLIQLTHSGRYSRPMDKAAPIIPQHDKLLDQRVGINDDYPVVTDEYLNELQDRYVQAALLAREAGFDGVDIKACHRYLVSELLASHTRSGKYGGSFENRSRFLLETIGKVREAAGEDFIIASRFNVFDAHPYPYGFGVNKDDCWKPDLEEPLRLVGLLVKAGVNLLSNSAGNPYYRFPNVTRPFDLPTIGGEVPDEHPLESVARLFDFTRQIQKEAGEVPVIGNGYTWMRQFIPNAGAANISDGSVAMVGLGREAFAYPSAPRDIVNNGVMDPRRCCITCSKCTQIMRDHGKTGCVIRDNKVYGPLFREARASAQK